MKKLILVSLLVLLSGCQKYVSQNETNKFNLPPEMKDCVVYYMTDVDGRSITAMRCPNSSTTTSQTVPKQSARTVVVIDGVDYVKEEK